MPLGYPSLTTVLRVSNFTDVKPAVQQAPDLATLLMMPSMR